MNIDDSVYWYSDKSVGAEINRGNNAGVDGHVGADVVRNDGKRVVL